MPYETGSNFRWLPAAWRGRRLCNSAVTRRPEINRTPYRPAPFSARGLFKKFSHWLKLRTYSILLKVVSLEIVFSCTNTMIPATFPFSSVFHVGLRGMLVSFCSFCCFISSVDSNRTSNFGDRKRCAGDRSGLEGARERTGVPPPNGKRSDRRAPSARKRYHDDERAAFPPKVQSFTFAFLVTCRKTVR